ncbi:MAG: tetratricopeptide repeat protein [Planctomycetota bacterium]
MATKPARRRAALYGVALLIGGGLLVSGFAITLPPDPATQLHGAALIGNGMGQYDKAIEMVYEVLEDHPDNAEAHLYLASFLAGSEQYDKSIEAYDEAIRRIEDREVRRDARVDRASLLLTLGRRKEFIEEKDALALQKRGHRIALLDGIMHISDRNWDMAADSLERAVAAKPGDETIKGRLYAVCLEQARADLSEGYFEKSAAHYGRARRLLPTAKEAILQAADLFLAMAKPQQALEVLSPLNPRARGVSTLTFRAATLLLEDGKIDAAVTAVESARAAKPDEVEELLRADPAWIERAQDPRVHKLLHRNENQGEARLPASD